MHGKMMLMVSALLLAACGKGAPDSGDDGEDDRLADELWSEMSDYEDWGQLEGWTGVVASSDGTHGDHVQIWANEVALAALSDDSPVPDGGIIVKAGYDDADGSSLRGLTAMQKIDGYSADSGDWFWAQFDAASGAASVAGAPSGCTGCHAAYGDYTAFDEL